MIPGASSLPKNPRLAALLRKPQTLTYAKYASGLSFSRALPTSFLTRLQESAFATGS
jgi:hypothetical protein